MSHALCILSWLESIIFWLKWSVVMYQNTPSNKCQNLELQFRVSRQPPMHMWRLHIRQDAMYCATFSELNRAHTLVDLSHILITKREELK